MILPISKLKIAGLGETLWDIQNGKQTFGGAPANFACHCANLGAKSYMISCVGNDDLGKQSIDFFKQMHVGIEAITTNTKYQTGIVNVQLDANGIPKYSIKEQVAWDNIPYSTKVTHLLQNLDAICFGTLALRSEISKKTILRYLEELPDTCLKIFDINIRQKYYNPELITELLNKADVLKLNDDELPLLANILNLKGDKIIQIQNIQKQFGLKLIILTLGAEGAIMLTPNEGSVLNPENNIKVISTVGAGDAFTAAATVGFLLNLPLSKINNYANKVAAFVCTQPGAVPILPNHLKFTKS